jgi:hypothetical protein
MKSKAFSIVIYPPAEISKKAINISKKLKKKKASFVLDGKNYFPHITLYMAEFPLKNIIKARKLLKQFAIKTKQFEMKPLKCRQSKGGYIDIEYRKSKQIKELHRNVIKLLNPLREGLLKESDKEWISKSSKIQQKNIKLFGYSDVGSEFFPHLTFTKLEKFNKSAILGINKSDFSFKVDKIGFAYLGDYGTCRKLIEIFDLS